MSFRRRMMMAVNVNSPIGDYIQDGLVFHMDCADYDLTQGVWIDKKGNVSFAMSNVSIDSKGGLIFNGTNSKGTASQGLGYNCDTHTIEIAIKRNANNTYSFILDAHTVSGINYGFLNNVTALCSMNVSRNTFVVPTSGFIAHSIHFNTPVSVVNGSISTFNNTKDSWTVLGSSASIGARSNNTSYFDGTIYQIRIYNRHLTTDEMIYNQQIDMRKYN